MFAAEAGGDGALFEGVVDCVTVCFVNLVLVKVAGWEEKGLGFVGLEGRRDLRGAEILFNDNVHAAKHFGQEEVVAGFVEGGVFGFVPAFLAW